MTIDQLYTSINEIMTHRDEYVEHMRGIKDREVEELITSIDNDREIIRVTLINWLDGHTDLTSLQKFVIQGYLKDQYGFDLDGGYEDYVTVTHEDLTLP